MTRLRLPNLTASTTAQQVRQLAAYLRDMVQQLNAALEEIERITGGENHGN